jgi:copper(I)-binding protein
MNLFKALAATIVTSVALYAQSVSVQDAYVREVPPNMINSAAFMTLKNSSDHAVALVSADSEAAMTVELHEHVNVNGMMQMRQIPKIEIPANGSTLLKPGGLHVMLIGLTHKLKEGNNVTLTLNFSNGETITLDAPIKKIAAGMMMKQHGASPAGKCASMKCGSGKCGM